MISFKAEMGAVIGFRVEMMLVLLRNIRKRTENGQSWYSPEIESFLTPPMILLGNEAVYRYSLCLPVIFEKQYSSRLRIPEIDDAIECLECFLEEFQATFGGKK